MYKHIASRLSGVGMTVLTASALAACSGGPQTGSLPIANDGTSLSSQNEIASQSATVRKVATSAAITTYEAAVMNSAPSAFFELADTSSTMLNAVNSAQSGTYGTSVGHGGPALNWEKKASTSFSGAGTPASLAQTHNFAALQPTSALAVEMLVQSAGVSGNTMHSIVAFGSAKTGVGYELDLTPRGTLKWTVSGGAPYFKWGYEGPIKLAVGTPHHVVGDYDGTTMHMYVDGVLDISKVVPGPLNYHAGSGSTAGIAVGGVIDGNGASFDGAVSDLAIYPRVLSASELSNHVAMFKAAPVAAPTPTVAPTASPIATPMPSPTAIAGAVTEVPKSVYSFANSVGVVAHFSYHDSPYGSLPNAYASLIENAHVHSIRGAGDGNGTLALFNGLCSNGIKHTLGFNVGVTPAYIASQIEFYGAQCIDAVEPSNEYDAYALNPAHPDPDWVNTIKNEQATIWKALKSNPAWANITVMGPSLASQSRYAMLGNMESTSDVGNQHDGTCDGSPMTTHYKNIVHDLALVRVSYPTKPVWTGETNYANNPATSPCAVSKEVGAKYVPRMFLDRFNIGIPHTFYNELSDAPSEGPGWGTLGLSDPNARPYPAYDSLQALLGSFPQSEPASSAVAPLSYSMTGNTNGLAHTLLQSSNGTYYLVFWLEIDSWDVKKKADITNAPQTFTLNLPRSFRTATLSVPNSAYGMNTSSLSLTGSVALTATDAPAVIAFK